MNLGKRSHVIITAALVACVTLTSAPASANHGETTRAVLLAPLILPAAILSVALPQPVVYYETQPRYAPHYRRVRHAPPPPPPRHHNDRRNNRNNHRR